MLLIVFCVCLGILYFDVHALGSVVLEYGVFCLISLRLKFLNVDEGLLADNITCYDHFLSYMFCHYKNTQNDTNFFNFLKVSIFWI